MMRLRGRHTTKAEIAKLVIRFLSIRLGLATDRIKLSTRLDTLAPSSEAQLALVLELTTTLRGEGRIGPGGIAGPFVTVGLLVDAVSGAARLRRSRASNEYLQGLTTRGSKPPGSYDLDDGLTTEVLDQREYRVWYATDRKPNDLTTVEGGYSSDPDTRVHLGACRVYIPMSHKIGSTGSSWLKRLLTLDDDRMRLRDIKKYDAATFWDRINSQILSTSAGERHAVVMVHGFNVSFEEAALRAAQIGFDLSIRGAMAFYSWPSQGTLRGYVADAARIEASEVRITQFLVEFSEKTNAEAVHLIAHSMGNRAVLRAVNNAARNARRRSKARFSQVILAAPDVDYQTFNEASSAYQRIARRTSLYVSARDRAVFAARALQKFPRIGLIPPIWTGPGIDTISVTNVPMIGLGHSFVADARMVLEDMHALMRTGLPPGKRFGLIEKVTDGGGRYWEIGS